MRNPHVPTATLRNCWNTVSAICARCDGASSSTDFPEATHGHRKTEQSLPGAAKWLLDHYRFLQHQLSDIREGLTDRSYRSLPRADSDAVVPAIHALARDLVRQMVEACVATGEPRSVDRDVLAAHFEAAQAQRTLCLAELWTIKPIVKLSLFEALDSALATYPLDSAACESVTRFVVTNLYTLDEIPWRELTESLSALHGILALDPAGMYNRMDFETRDAYRRATESIAKRGRLDEQDVARAAIECACERRRAGADDKSVASDHVGYYLVDEGVSELERRVRSTPSITARIRRSITSSSGLLYPAAIVATTGLLVAGLATLLHPVPAWFWIVLILPAMQAAVALVNRVSHAAVFPRRLPRLDFSKGIPDDCRTFVVVPTLLVTRADVDELLEKLELHYLSNRDANLKLALLTDGPDSSQRIDQHDRLAEICRDGIEKLNERYVGSGGGPFYLFHRVRRWNERESIWMGHERKRGKLDAFNAFLLGGPDPFVIKAGDLSAIGRIRYVITLDRDTQLPLESARGLIGTAAHPLNRPFIDPETNTVRRGYGVLQPRIGVSMVSAERSRFARVQSGAVGLDPYTTAVSDVYQDLFGHGSFAGKGLYDLAAFQSAMSNRFPDNQLLSHDLIEGEHARVGFVSDVEMIDDYPSSYEAYSKRKHRWTRGDWQLIRWLAPRVPDASGHLTANPLSMISRWKVFDNLRRSTLEASMLGLLLAGWREGHAIACTIAVVVLLNAGAYLDLLISAARLPPPRLRRSHLRAKLSQFGRSQLETLLCLVFLPHQALVATDAVVRALGRQFITGRRLLEWESMAQTDSTPLSRSGFVRTYLFFVPAAALALIVGGRHAEGGFSLLPIGVCLAWTASPLIAAWMNRRSSPPASWTPAESGLLRDLALRTWRYFVDASQPATHWLVPDNIDDASGHVAHRTSPTNIGLQLGATLAAHDFGYLTCRELACDLTRLLDIVERLETCRGHLYNWYDTRTLEPLFPRYLSSVDSGHLCASLVTIKHGCLEALNQPILGSRTWAGLRDHLSRARKALQQSGQDRWLQPIAELLEQGDQPHDLRGWREVLSTLRGDATDIIERLETSDLTLAEAGVGGEEAVYWLRALSVRIGEALQTIDTFAPFVETTASSELNGDSLAVGVCDLAAADRRIPTLTNIHSYYDELEGAATNSLHALETADAAPAPALRRLLQQVSAARANANAIAASLEAVSERGARLSTRPDFRFLFDWRRKLLRVGYDVEREELDASCYGLLASEARVAVFFAIAKRDLPYEAWFHLGRTLTSFGGLRTLVSWSGTMFEYAMPLLFMKNHENTLLGASVRRSIQIQQTYGRERRVPWGLSEAAYSACDETQGRRYQAFGIPELAVKRMNAADLVIAPYATVLALTIDRTGAMSNLRSMLSKEWLGRYGFYESIDCRAHAQDRTANPVVVPLFMAHHQGMSLIALDNALFDNAMQRRFHAEPLVATAELLLQERLPAVVPARPRGVRPSDMPTAPHLQLTARLGREIAAPAGVVLPAL
jgi:hypothetical protein